MDKQKNILAFSSEGTLAVSNLSAEYFTNYPRSFSNSDGHFFRTEVTLRCAEFWESGAQINKFHAELWKFRAEFGNFRAKIRNFCVKLQNFRAEYEKIRAEFSILRNEKALNQRDLTKKNAQLVIKGWILSCFRKEKALQRIKHECRINFLMLPVNRESLSIDKIQLSKQLFSFCLLFTNN